MTTPIRDIEVFLASPGDLAPERQVFKSTIDALNKGFGDGLGVRFTALEWEDVLAETGRRTQSVINEEVLKCDIFILVLHRRWGQDAPDSSATSYTEEEYNLARKRWQDTHKPEILIFFKNVDPASMADPGAQLQRVIAFRKRLEDQRDTLARTFNTEAEFGQEVDKHLRVLARNDLAPTSISPQFDVTVGADALVVQPKVDYRLVQVQLAERALTRSAIDAATAGRLQEAELLFAKAVEGTTDLQILEVAANFYRQVGQVESATRLVARQAALAKDRLIAARYLVGMTPKETMEAVQQQIVEKVLENVREDDVDKVRDIFADVFTHERFFAKMAELYAYHFTTAELLLSAQVLGTAEGQSMQRKMPRLMKDIMEWAGRETQRAIEDREQKEHAIDAVVVPEPADDQRSFRNNRD